MGDNGFGGSDGANFANRTIFRHCTIVEIGTNVAIGNNGTIILTNVKNSYLGACD